MVRCVGRDCGVDQPSAYEAAWLVFLKIGIWKNEIANMAFAFFMELLLWSSKTANE